DELLAKRAQVAQWYNVHIDEIPGVSKPYLAETTTFMSWFVYVVHLSSVQVRDRLIHNLKEVGIPSRPYFTPIHLQPFYRQTFGWKAGDLPNTERAGETCLALPFSSVMQEEQVDYVCNQIKRICNELPDKVLN